MGDAPGMRLAEFFVLIRQRLGTNAAGLEGGVDEVVFVTLRFWPERAMGSLANKAKERDKDVLDAVAVICAKVREYLEARWGTDTNTAAALDKLIQPVVVEMANIWFSSALARSLFRRCIVEASREKC